MNIRTTADRLEDLASFLCCDVDRNTASTGSVYLTVSRRDDEFTIRVADHADAHATSAYSCDGFEGTASGARKFLLERIGTSEATVRRLRRARRNLKSREVVSDRQRWIAGYAVQNGLTIEAAAAKCPF